jgi:hypothetical protein
MRRCNVSGTESYVWVRLGRVDYWLWYWVVVYQMKDWINSDGKTVKPHNLEMNPEDAKKSKKE